MLKKLNCYVKRLSILLITVALIVVMVGCDLFPTSQNLEIRDWYDLDAVRNNLGSSHLLMNDLDSTTDGYEELASPTANQGKGWQPIGHGDWDGQQWVGEMFEGTFDGQGYEIRDLFINRPDEGNVGLFGIVAEGGRIEDIGVVNADVTGTEIVGGLVGGNGGTVSNSYSSGSVTGDANGTGGLVGSNGGTISNSYSTGSVTGYLGVGGLAGGNAGTVSNSYSSGNVTGNYGVGGLVGSNEPGTVSNSYSTGSVTGNDYVGGLVGWNYEGTVSNSYSTGSVTGNSFVGGLVGANDNGTVIDSFWDTETSGQTTSDGGTGKTTTQMQDIATFLGAAWEIIMVAPGVTNPTYTWNIVDSETYPFLSWQAV